MVVQLTQLRTGRAWSAKDLSVECEEATPLRGVSGAALDMEVILERYAQLPKNFCVALFVLVVLTLKEFWSLLRMCFRILAPVCGTFLQFLGRI